MIDHLVEVADREGFEHDGPENFAGGGRIAQGDNGDASLENQALGKGRENTRDIIDGAVG